MNLTSEQYDALQHMGIPVWTFRSTEGNQNNERPSQTAALSIDVNKPLVLIVDDELSLDANRLLTALLFSIGFRFDEVAIMNIPDFELLSRFSANQSVALILGFSESQQRLTDHPYHDCQQMETGLPVLFGPTLSQMLQTPELKEKIWQTLLNLKRIQEAQFG